MGAKPSSAPRQKYENYIFKVTAASPRDQWVNLMSPNDTIMHEGSWFTSDQLMACHLIAPSHCPNPCHLIVNETTMNTSLIFSMEMLMISARKMHNIIIYSKWYMFQMKLTILGNHWVKTYVRSFMPQVFGTLTIKYHITTIHHVGGYLCDTKQQEQTSLWSTGSC